MEEIGYCVNCKKKVQIKNVQEQTMDNNMKSMQGTCKECGCSVFTILENPEQTVNTLKNKLVKKKALCVKAGKLAEDITRHVYPIGKKISQLSTSVYQAAQETIQKGAGIVTSPCKIASSGGSRLKKDIALYMANQQKIFTQLGTCIFHLSEKQSSNIFTQPEVKKLIDEATKIKESIQKINQEIQTLKLEQEKQDSFNNAVSKLNHQNPRTRLTAIRVIELIGWKKGITYLTKLLDDPDETVRTKASTAINILTQTASTEAKKSTRKHKSLKELRTTLDVNSINETKPDNHVDPNTNVGPQLETTPA